MGGTASIYSQFGTGQQELSGKEISLQVAELLLMFPSISRLKAAGEQEALGAPPFGDTGAKWCTARGRDACRHAPRGKALNM